MQPPLPPLNVEKLKQLVSEADLIVVGKVVRVGENEAVDGQETKIELQCELNVVEFIKGHVSNQTIIIREIYPTFAVPTPSIENVLEMKKVGPGRKTVKGFRAGPGVYHGKYTPGERIMVFLYGSDGNEAFKPLGSGTYDGYLCEFLIGQDGVEPLYFRFSDDVKGRTGSEQAFIGLIRSLLP